MRKLFLITLILAAAWPVSAAEKKEKKLKDTTHFEFYFDDDKTAATRVTTPLSELRLANRPGQQNIGAAVSTAKLFPRLPLTVKTGNLTAGGPLSILNSPELSSGNSPFTQSLAAPAPLAVSLPGKTSFSKPVSAFFEISFLPKASLPDLTANLWITPQAPYPVNSLYISQSLFKDCLTLSASCTNGIFYHKANTTASWFLKTPYYPAGSHHCMLLQLSADLRQGSSFQGLCNLTTALYESPFGFYQLLYRADLKLSTKRFDFSAQAFFNPYDEVLTSYEKKLTPSLQAKGGLIFKTPFRLASLLLKTPVFLKLGTNAFYRLNLTQTEHPLKVNTGLVFTTGPVNTSFSYSLSGNLLSQTPESPPSDFLHKDNSFQFKLSWNQELLSPSFTATATLPKASASAQNYKLAASAAFSPKSKKLPLNLTAQTSYTFAYTPAPAGSPFQPKKLTAGLSAHMNFRRITISGKVSAEIDLYLE